MKGRRVDRDCAEAITVRCRRQKPDCSICVNTAYSLRVNVSAAFYPQAAAIGSVCVWDDNSNSSKMLNRSWGGWFFNSIENIWILLYLCNDFFEVPWNFHLHITRSYSLPIIFFLLGFLLKLQCFHQPKTLCIIVYSTVSPDVSLLTCPWHCHIIIARRTSHHQEGKYTKFTSGGLVPMSSKICALYYIRCGHYMHMGGVYSFGVLGQLH